MKDGEKIVDEAMVRFNLVSGLVYTLIGDEAVKVFKEREYSIADACIFNYDGKTVAINTDHIVSIEWKGVE